MTMMQPDPAAEFREEIEFRSKVYRMLSLGLSTTEVENLLRCKIDWALFSESTLRSMVENSSKVVVSIPAELQEKLFRMSSSLESTTKKSDQNFKTLKKDAIKFKEDFRAEFKKEIKDVFDTMIGMITVFGSLAIILILVVAGILLFK